MKKIKFNKSVFSIVIAMLMVGFLLAGCANSSGTSSPSAKLEKTSPSYEEDTKQLDSLIGLLGRSDQELVNAMGEGRVNQDKTTNKVISRKYQISLFDQTLDATASLDQEAKLRKVAIFLPASKINNWAQQLTGIYGEVVEENTQGPAAEDSDGLQEMIWHKEGVAISLKGVSGGLAMELYKY